jgi:hypothetical protein
VTKETIFVTLFFSLRAVMMKRVNICFLLVSAQEHEEQPDSDRGGRPELVGKKVDKKKQRQNWTEREPC